MRLFFFSVCSIFLFMHYAYAQFGDMPDIPADFMAQLGMQEPMMGPSDGGLSDGRLSDESDEPDSGNWYEKLHWWKEAKRVYTVDIHDAMEQLKGIVQDYETKKKSTFAAVKERLASLPVTAQAAEPLINTYLAELKKKRESLAENQTQDVRAALTEIEEQEKALEGLKSDFDQLTKLNDRLNEAFNEVFAKQVKECENYEERALEYFERIEKVLDDKKAHRYYDIVENSLENIRAIIQYLIGPLQIFTDDVMARIDVLVPKIKKTIEDLENQGIQVRVLTEKEKAEQAAAAKKREEARLKAEAEKKALEEWKKMSWWRKAFSLVGSFFSSLWNFIVNLFSSLFGSIASLFSGGGAPPQPVKKP